MRGSVLVGVVLPGCVVAGSRCPVVRGVKPHQNPAGLNFLWTTSVGVARGCLPFDPGVGSVGKNRYGLQPVV